MATRGYDHFFKLMLVGDYEVGKASLMLRGEDFKVCTLEQDAEKIKLQIWDTAQLERHGAIPRSYYPGARGIIIVYDATDKESFNKVKYRVQETERHAEDGVNKLLVGIKSDRTSERAVTYDEGKGLADSLKIQFMETSAKNADNVEQALQTMAREIKQALQAWMDPKLLTVAGPKTKGSAVGALYADRGGAQWVGKAGSPQVEDSSDRMSKYRKGLGLDAVKEKVASDGYSLLSRRVGSPYQVPEVKLAELPLMNKYTQENVLAECMYDKLVEATSRPDATKGNLVHLMSKFVKGFIPMRDLSTSDGRTMAAYVQSEHTLPETVMVGGKEYRLAGAMEVLAASRLLGDTDVLGGRFDNAGVGLSPHEARAVKIDTGYSFNYTGPENKLAQSFTPYASEGNSLASKKDIQYANMGPAVIQWGRLTPTQRRDFLTFLFDGIKILRNEEVLGAWLDRRHYGEDHVRNEDFAGLREMMGRNLRIQEEVYREARTGRCGVQ